MTGQICFEDVEKGMEVKPLIKHPTNVQLFRYSAVTRIEHRIHYDKDFAIADGHPDVLVHGPLQGAFLVQLMTDWIGGLGQLKKISYQVRGRSFPGDTIFCKGKVINRYIRDGEHYIACEIWSDRQNGDLCGRGQATVILPRRKWLTSKSSTELASYISSNFD